jgi:hypothetical protein
MKRWQLALLALAFAVGAAALALLAAQPPGPLPASAPADRFSAGRSMAFITAIAATPHPLGSADEARVRRYLVGRLTMLDLRPRVLSDTVAAAPNLAGTVHNIVARLPGSSSTGAILLIAHYDSGVGAPGAADDGAGVATVLETVRALEAVRPLRNDVVILLTDGEELGRLGIGAFLRRETDHFGVRVALNFDDPGSSGPLLMDQTSPGDSWLVHQLASVAPGPLTSSLMDEITRRQTLPTDFTPLVAAGVPGLSFAFTDGRGRYDTAFDTVARLSAASVQQQGACALALVRRLGKADLRIRASRDAVFFDAFGGRMVVYDGRWALVFAGLTGGLFMVVVAAAGRRRFIRLRGVLIACGGCAVALLTCLALVTLVWVVLRSFTSNIDISSAFAVNDAAHRVGLVALTLASASWAYFSVLRYVRAFELAVAALGYWLAGAVITCVALPGASYLFEWPLFFSLVGLGVLVRMGKNSFARPVGLLVACVAALPGILLVTSAVDVLLISAGLRLLGTVLALWLALGLLAPLLALAPRWAYWALPLAVGALGLVITAAGSSGVYDSTSPQSDSVIYQQVATRSEARWISFSGGVPDPWTSQFLGQAPQRSFSAEYFLGLGFTDFSWARAPALHLPAPTVRLVRDQTRGGRRTLELYIASRRGAPNLTVLENSAVGRLFATLNGVPVGGADAAVVTVSGIAWYLDYYGMPAAGAYLTLVVDAHVPMLLTVADYSYGLPAQLVAHMRPRPPAAVPSVNADATIVERTFAIGPGPT